MTERTEIEATAAARFIALGFDNDFTLATPSGPEQEVIDQIIKNVGDHFHAGTTYILGLALDFTMVAQKLSHFDPEAKEFRPALDEQSLFARYPRTTTVGTRNVNTLTLKFSDGSRPRSVGIRTIEEAVCDLFIASDRTGYPSAYVYNTGMWQHYKELLVDCFRLSESGRYLVSQRLIDFGLTKLTKNTFFGREVPRPRLFEEIITDYPRVSTGTENAGMLMQGIAYAYMKADRPHLSLIVDKSRTGSAKQRRFGDIDAYYGLDLEVSIEVKDENITASQVETELGQFARDVRMHRVQGLVFVKSIEVGASEWLITNGVIPQDEQTTLTIVRLWDWQKQNNAVHGLLHFLSHVEQKPEAVNRLLEFINTRDPSHDSLAYVKELELE